MIVEQSPCKTVGAGFNKKAAKAYQKPFLVNVVHKDVRAFYAPNNDVLQ